MEVTLSPQTQQLLAEQLEKSGFTSADELVRFALEQLNGGPRGCDYEDLDPETRAALEEAEAEFERGEEGIPVEEAFARLRRKHLGE